MTLLAALGDDLRTAFERVGYDTDSLLEALGDEVHAALGRSEPIPVRLAARELGDLGTLIRLFLLTDDCDEGAVADALAPLDVDAAAAAGLVERVPGTSSVRAALDVRPVDLGAGNRWIFSDLDGALRPGSDSAHATDRDHVLGVGHASLSLLQATPTTPVGTLLDLGTGSGVQLLHGATFAEHVTGTDVNARALGLARATAALNRTGDEAELELLEGSWFEPVAGRTFDRIVANPPFVVGDPRVRQTYRDSGLDLDGASALVVAGAAEHLAPGGTAAMLASWVHRDGEDWRARVASWLPSHGIDAWVVQRDVADPSLYVGTWLRDGGLDPRSAAAAERGESWLTHLRSSGVTGVGFGFVYLRRTDEPTDVLAEDMTQGFSDPLGGEAIAYFDRLTWLREHDVLGARYTLEPSTALERVSVPGPDGWNEQVVRVHRGNGPHWQHEIDDLGAAFLAGMRPDGLVLEELIALLAVGYGADDESADLTQSAVELVQALVRHGIVLPA
ncbi:class I SAM-dependent methyltransferase [Rhodococcus sp. HNM0569]|uniref:DUF7782 domain-containing protein n=1 Tax=Rhodococcus sp. HNM0569 TaxID=2716340 RepID=UPI00146EC267|nr:class I SAM-dependent methyltransferase [Rhodococcus sp. HNM0569]NLU81394.1 class I SAM-dependent methyltransferase [Rhodococcus sp. HNM0569]